MRNFCLVFGEACIVKSTAVAKALHGAHVLAEFKQPVAHIVYKQQSGMGCQLGRSHGEFKGTDGLSYTAINKIPPFINGTFSDVLAEGDRLSNLSFINRLNSWNVTTVHIYSTDPVLGMKRRAERAARIGAKQNEQWVRGRRTKAYNLAGQLPDCIWLDAASIDVAEALAELEVFKNLRSGG